MGNSNVQMIKSSNLLKGMFAKPDEVAASTQKEEEPVKIAPKEITLLPTPILTQE
jgi:hypothetical protein